MDIEVREGTLIFRVDSELLKGSDETLFKRLQERAGDGPLRVVISLRAVEYVSSSGIGSLVRLYKDVRDHEGLLCLAATSPRVQDLLRLAGVDLLFAFAQDEDAACEMVKNPELMNTGDAR